MSGIRDVGQEWGMLGSIEESKGRAVIDRVDETYDSRTIGLTARQLDNIGADYGTILLDIGDEDVETDYNNAYGANSPDRDNGIVISPDIAQEYGLVPGDNILLTRESTETEELLYEARNHDGEFGQNRDYQGTPQSVVPVFIDGDEEDSETKRVGLSAMQSENLGAPTGSVVQVSYNGEKTDAEVYNAAGIRRVGGKGVRISEPLAKETGVEQGEEFSIEHVLSQGQGNQIKGPEDVARLLDSNNRRRQS